MEMQAMTKVAERNLRTILPEIPDTPPLALMPERARKPVGTKPKTVRRTMPKRQETRREKFLRLGQPRVINALHAIRLIGNLASSNYEFTDDDVQLINDALLDGVKQTMEKFSTHSPKERLENTFRLVHSA